MQSRRARHTSPTLLLTSLAASVLACGSPTTAMPVDAGATTGESGSTNDGSPDTPADTRRGQIDLVLTVDWEGREMTETNLAAMVAFRTKYPSIPIVHFLNAAYFTKPGADAVAVTALIRRVLRPMDELGLHIHGWKSLFEASGVTFRSGPTFWGTTLTAADCASDCGHEVPISLYTAEELQKVMAFSVKTLEANGFGHASSFRAGGWLAGETVRTALVLEHFAYDHSSVPSPFLADELKGYPLLDAVKALWGDTTPSSQPYSLKAGGGSFTEVPDNGALADYITAPEILGVFDDAVKALRAAPETDRVVSIGFHQETAKTYLPRITVALDGIAQRAATTGDAQVSVAYVTSHGVAITK